MKNSELTSQIHPMITHDHLGRRAIIYIRQSTEDQVRENTGSTEYQRNLAAVAQAYGWQDSDIEIIDEIWENPAPQASGAPDGNASKI